jgi:hypothetical protein
VFVVPKIFKTDQPGRVVACFIVSPLLIHKGFMYDDSFIKSFAVVLFAWDFWWLVKCPPKE